MKHFEGDPYPDGSRGSARLLIGLLLFELCAPVFPTVGQLPVIPDPQLEAAVRCTLFKTDSGPVTRLDLQGLTQLFAPNHAIASLAGFECARNLLELTISGSSL